MQRLEKDTEKSFVDWLETFYVNEYYALKLSVLGRVGFPDRLIVGRKAFVMFIEFKRVGEEPRKLQLYWHKKLRALGFIVVVCETKEGAISEFKKYRKKHI